MRFKMPDDTNRWMTSGWWSVDPGKTLQPMIVTANGNLYFWAQDATGTWNGNNDSTSVTAPIVSNNFVHVDGAEIQGTDKRTVSMFHRLYDKWGNYTVKFTCADGH
jgi:uncharacterized membrane protein